MFTNSPQLVNACFTLKETTESTTRVSYLDLLVHIDGFLTFKLFDKRDYFNFPTVNLPHLDSNIPVKPAYGVYVSYLIWYFCACTYYSDFLYRHQVLVQKLVSQGYCKKELTVNIVFSNFVLIIMLKIHIIFHKILWSRKEYIIIL